MKKTTFALITIVALALILSACGGADTPEPIVIEKEVIKEVPVERIVEKEVIKEVVVEKVVKQEVVRTVEVERVLIATPTPPPAGAPQFGGTLKVVSQASIANFDIHANASYVTIAVALHIFESPFGWDADVNFKPRVVDSWEVSADNKTFTFTLRDGNKFHDGSAFTSDDVIASIDRTANAFSPAMKFMVTGFTGDNWLEKVDDKTFNINLTKPYGEVISTLSYPYGSGYVMTSEVAGTVPGSDFITEEQAIGSGPYKFSSWEPGHRIILERFDEYEPRSEPASWVTGGLIPYIDKIEWLEVPDEETKIAGLETGEWDVVDGAAFDFFKRLKNNTNMVVPLYKPGHRSNMGINNAKPPFDASESGRKARLALQAALDIDAVMASLGDSELWITCPALFFCGTPLESHAAAELYNEADIEKAKRLLIESGYDGSPVTLLNPTDYGTITPLGHVIKPMMEKVGFNVDMPALDWSSIVPRLGTLEGHNLYTSWGVHWGFNANPITWNALAILERPGSTRNPRFPELVLKFATALDPAAKMAAIDEIQTLFYNDPPAIMLGQWFSIYPHRSWLKNFNFAHIPMYFNAYLDR
jgi:peptide/nickel transport system substrate-binding protein